MEAIINHWKENIRKNSKIILAIGGDILVTFFIVLLYAINTGLDIGVFIFILTMSIKPFIILYINMIMKGEIQHIKEATRELEQNAIEKTRELEQKTALLEQKIEFLEEKGILVQEKKHLIRELAYVRELSEYKILVAGKNGKVQNSVLANQNWNESNETIEELEKKEETIEEEKIDKL